MGTRLRTAAALTLTAALAGCGFFSEPTPDVANPKTAVVPGFTFSHPGNWSTTTQSEAIEGFTVTTRTVESKGNAVAMVQVYEPGIEMTPDQVFDQFMSGVSDAAEEELGGMLNVKTGGSTEITRTVMGEEWVGRRGGFSVSVLGEEVPSRIEMVQWYSDARNVIIFSHAPNEDWAKASPGFDQIYETFAAQ